MVCSQCGAGLEGASRFCPRCGAPVVVMGAGYGAQRGAPPPPVFAAAFGMTVRRSFRTLGVLWCCFAAYRVLAGLIGLVFVRAFVLHRGFDVGWPLDMGGSWAPGSSGLAWLVPVIAVATVVSSALSAFAGWSLLTRQSWGRVLAIVAACLALIKFPLGTALGIYTLVVLTRRGVAEEYEATANEA